MSDNIPVIIISDNVQTQEVLSLYIRELEYFTLANVFDKVANFLSVENKSDNLVIVLDINKDIDEKLDFVLQMTKQNSSCKIVVVSDDINIDVMVRFVRAGVCEFLSTPVIKNELANAMGHVFESITQKTNLKQDTKCKVISIFSNKGGIGKTSLASNLALELAQLSKERTALLDFNFQSGDITTFMDLKPTFDISYFLQNLGNLNEDFLMGTLEQYRQTSLYVLANTPYLKQSETITPKQIVNLLNVLKKTFSYIVIDTEPSFDEKNMVTLTESNLIFLLTTANLPALRNTQKCLEIFEKSGFDTNKTKVILNRYMENDEIGVEDVEKVIGREIYQKIPNNYFTIMSSINKGIPLSIERPDSNIAKSYRELAQKVTDDLLKNNIMQQYSSVLR